MRKLKVPFLAFGAIVLLAFVVSCKKTTSVTNVTKDTTIIVKDSVYYSSWQALSMTYDATDTLYYQDFLNSKITSSFVGSGVVVSYLGAGSSGDTIAYPATDYGLYTVMGYSQGQGFVEVTSYGQENDYTGSLYRYVLIPGTVLQNSSFKGYTQSQLQKVSITDLKKGLSGGTTSSATAQ